ncbi:MAG: hypothetical protein KJ583_02900 [Nanoarchaeota archaeon]|nr:hypothetical protein [Nanoarchaeota archaeon]MBU1270043.1 hypothetical protein [Nanoarchaeota archaeon]MBU1604243.1 hypothetical protein [Nanoarchaeota archaeon]MBU2443779.1 hypothetical protein [Nanoarchaeota archaeon]
MKENMTERRKMALLGKEVIVGVLCLGFGGYSLLAQYGVIRQAFELPQMIANILLTLAGLFLLLQAFKLTRYEYRRSRFLG